MRNKFLPYGKQYDNGADKSLNKSVIAASVPARHGDVPNIARDASRGAHVRITAPRRHGDADKDRADGVRRRSQVRARPV